MKELLNTHPGLKFLDSTPEFQEKYTDTVIIRIFWNYDLDDNNKLNLSDVRKSNIYKSFMQVDEEEDINNVRDLFSYEHFYVLYCRFWELDNDHDYYITKEEFSKYDGHALSRKAVDRIFTQIPKSIESKNSQMMSYADFVCFMLAEEDKSSIRSIK